MQPLPTDTLLLERMFSPSGLVSVSYLEAGLAVASSVARLVSAAGYGTGFLVSPRLLLTNNHVIPSAEDAARTYAEFNYQAAADGQLMASVTFNFEPNLFFVTDEHLDYTLLAVNQSTPDGRALNSFDWFRWNRLVEEQGKILIGEYVTLIEHPYGNLKQVALRDNEVVDLLENFIHYLAATAPGSSGAPVFNDQWEVVALHHSSVKKRDEQGRVLNKEGEIWTPEMGTEQIGWEANEGVRISQVVQHIKQQSLSTEAQLRLRDGMFEAEPPVPVPSPIGH